MRPSIGVKIAFGKVFGGAVNDCWGSRFMETDMKHTVNSISENMHPLLECTLVDYANRLRANYPDRRIRNAAVFASGVPEFARLGYIELVDARTGVREGVPDFLVRAVKRAKHQPVWIPAINFPDDPMSMFDEMRPSMKGDKIVWHHRPSRRKPTWSSPARRVRSSLRSQERS